MLCAEVWSCSSAFIEAQVFGRGQIGTPIILICLAVEACSERVRNWVAAASRRKKFRGGRYARLSKTRAMTPEQRSLGGFLCALVTASLRP